MDYKEAYTEFLKKDALLTKKRISQLSVSQDKTIG